MSACCDTKGPFGARIVCGLIGIYHVGAGVSGLLGGALAARVAEVAYGVSASSQFLVTDQFTVLARFIGALALAFGVMMLYAAAKPSECRPVFVGGIIYFAVRLVTRIACAQQLQKALGITTARNLRSMASISVLLVGLIVFFPRRAPAPVADDTP